MLCASHSNHAQLALLRYDQLQRLYLMHSDNWTLHSKMSSKQSLRQSQRQHLVDSLAEPGPSQQSTVSVSDSLSQHELLLLLSPLACAPAQGQSQPLSQFGPVRHRSQAGQDIDTASETSDMMGATSILMTSECSCSWVQIHTADPTRTHQNNCQVGGAAADIRHTGQTTPHPHMCWCHTAAASTQALLAKQNLGFEQLLAEQPSEFANSLSIDII